MNREELLSKLALARQQGLKALDLSSLELTELPDEIGLCSNLESLDLSDNRLTTLPVALGHLDRLQLLDLRDNQLTDLPENLVKLQRLAFLRLGNNHLSKLPNVVCRLSGLRRLVLRGNRLSSLPPELGALTQLQELALHDNLLTALPETIDRLLHLETLLLPGNQLQTLPESFARLPALKRLDLARNRIMDLPPELGGLRHLAWLDLHHNSLPVPEAILDEVQEPSKIIAAYHKALASERRHLDEAKLMVLGDRGTGKSSLVARLLDGRFVADMHPTEGVSLRTWRFSDGQRRLRLNLWDFSGADHYFAAHPYFITPQGLILLVMDGAEPEPERRLARWMRIIRSLAGRQASVALICHRADRFPLELDWNEIRQRYPSIKVAVRRASSMTGEGIESVQQAITKLLDTFEPAQALYWRSWLDTKAIVEEINESHIPYRFYQALCRERGIHDGDQQEQLANRMHLLGSAVYFRNHPLAGSTDDLLDPAWLTQALYRPLGSKRIRDNGGVLERKELGQILDPGLHGSSKHALVLTWLRRFQICFPLLEEPGEEQAQAPHVERFLFPDLLPVNYTSVGMSRETLDFSYHYDHLPPALMGRLLVRFYPFLHSRTCWRDGLLLASEGGGNRALIQMDREAGTLRMRIWGQPKMRAVFLALLRLSLERLNSIWSDFEVQEKVPLAITGAEDVGYRHLHAMQKAGLERFLPVGVTEPIAISPLLETLELPPAPPPESRPLPNKPGRVTLKQRLQQRRMQAHEPTATPTH
ncbi:small GTP-binding protein [Magnetococcus marinus MC-1]|uniref:Small GTP-binding protein n=1 Tax=Magnetococcus marinus (strain ATCC BAA-1437 / JCM 17883 / MC-1) TaxID=156889 RepID=A0L4U3_MAGMM|nr:COR domain-containing protein [Magnetococcus marinus]ABK42986.1 small GTP-binding protein [Magnetococcus marinus MC-1]